MKYVKILGLAAVAAMAMMAFAGSASATTLATKGVATNASETISASIGAGSSVLLSDTAGFAQNTCSTSNVSGSTSSPFTGSSVTGAISSLTFQNCTRPVTVTTNGSLEVTWTSGTKGSVASEGAVVDVSSVIGNLKCETGGTTNIGILTGVKEGSATMDINAVLNCGIIPSATWTGSYAVTTANLSVEN